MLDRRVSFPIALGETNFSKHIIIHKDVKRAAVVWFMYNDWHPEDSWFPSQDSKSSLINSQCQSLDYNAFPFTEGKEFLVFGQDTESVI
jgi:hypothetical protein